MQAKQGAARRSRRSGKSYGVIDGKRVKLFQVDVRFQRHHDKECITGCSAYSS